jgi:hypothetical protein
MNIKLKDLRKVLREGLADLVELEEEPLTPDELEKLRSIQPEDPSKEKYWDPNSPEHGQQWKQAMQSPPPSMRSKLQMPQGSQPTRATSDTATYVRGKPPVQTYGGDTEDTRIRQVKKTSKIGA